MTVLLRQIAAVAGVIVAALQGAGVVNTHWVWILGLAGAIALYLEDPANIPIVGPKLAGRRAGPPPTTPPASSPPASSAAAPPLG